MIDANEYRKAYAEIIEILKYIDIKLVKKIPDSFIDFLYKNKDYDYNVKINFYKENWEEDILKETKAILTLINRNYFMFKEEN